jgi:hypothetical protein
VRWGRDERVSRNGYFTGQGIDDLPSVLAALEERFDSICVGVHDDVEVVLGHDWNGSSQTPPRALRRSSLPRQPGVDMVPPTPRPRGIEAACRQLLRASYLGTLLAAATLGKDRVVLTLIGGGVFANPFDPKSVSHD